MTFCTEELLIVGTNIMLMDSIAMMNRTGLCSIPIKWVVKEFIVLKKDPHDTFT